MKVCFCVRGATRILEALREAMPGHEVVECAPGEVPSVAREVDVLVPAVAPVREEALASKRLRLVQQFGAGLDSVDVAGASRLGIPVANVPAGETPNADSVAELALLLLLALVRRLREAEQSIRDGRLGGPVGTTLLGKTAVVLGFGAIGRGVARRLRALGVRVVAVSRRGPRGDGEPADRHVAVDRLDEVLPEADLLVVATPLDERTRGLVGARALARLRRGAYLVNVARGAVVEREALLEALRSGHLAGAGLDVFWEEPVDPADPLLRLNVVATPHVGGATDASFAGIARAVAENVERLARGERLRNCVNAEAVEAGEGRARR